MWEILRSDPKLGTEILGFVLFGWVGPIVAILTGRPSSEDGGARPPRKSG